MGGRGLTALLKRYAPNSLHTVSCKAFCRQTIAIDGTCQLNKFMYGIEGHPYPHILGFYKMTQFCAYNDITPIFVFDGPNPPIAKKTEIEKRVQRRQKTQKSLACGEGQSIRLPTCSSLSDKSDNHDVAIGKKNGVDETDGNPLDNMLLKEKNTDGSQSQNGETHHQSAIMEVSASNSFRSKDATDCDRLSDLLLNIFKKSEHDESSLKFTNEETTLKEAQNKGKRNLASLDSRFYVPTQIERENCQEFLTALGFSCLSSDYYDAEALCASLANSGQTTATVSENLGTIAYGDKPMLRNFFSRDKPILSIDPIIARQELRISKDSFINLCILCGTDFSGKIRGAGPNIALKYIQKFGSMEQVLSNLNPRHIPEETFDYSLARKVFNDLPEIPVPYGLPESEHSSSFYDPNFVLNLYEIDPEEADLSVQEILLQQSTAND